MLQLLYRTATQTLQFCMETDYVGRGQNNCARVYRNIEMIMLSCERLL